MNEISIICFLTSTIDDSVMIRVKAQSKTLRQPFGNCKMGERVEMVEIPLNFFSFSLALSDLIRSHDVLMPANITIVAKEVDLPSNSLAVTLNLLIG